MEITPKSQISFGVRPATPFPPPYYLLQSDPTDPISRVLQASICQRLSEVVFSSLIIVVNVQTGKSMLATSFFWLSLPIGCGQIILF